MTGQNSPNPQPSRAGGCCLPSDSVMPLWRSAPSCYLPCLPAVGEKLSGRFLSLAVSQPSDHPPPRQKGDSSGGSYGTPCSPASPCSFTRHVRGATVFRTSLCTHMRNLATLYWRVAPSIPISSISARRRGNDDLFLRKAARLYMRGCITD